MAMNRLQYISFGLVFLCFGAIASAQGTKSDYERADKLGGLVQGKVFKAKVTPHWLEGNSRFWYRNDLADGKREFILVDAEKGTREAAFDHAKLAMALKEKLGKEVAADRLPLEGIQVEGDGAFRFNTDGKGWKFEPASGVLTEAELIKLPEPRRPGEGRGPRGAGGPRGRRKDSRNVGTNHLTARRRPSSAGTTSFLKFKDGGEEVQLTTDGKPEDSYDGGVFWAPDSSRFVALKTQRAEEHKVYLIESSPRDQTQPKLHTMDYQKPGDRIAVTQAAPVRRRTPARSSPFPTPSFRIRGASRNFVGPRTASGSRFSTTSAATRCCGFWPSSGETGEVGTLVNEESKTFVDYAHKRFTHYARRRPTSSSGCRERDGWNHLYLIDARTGDVKNQITKGEWVVRGVDRVDEEKRQIWFRAGGIYPEQDPYYVHYCRVNFDGTGPGEADRRRRHARRSSTRRTANICIDTYSPRRPAPGHGTAAGRGRQARLRAGGGRRRRKLLETGWKHARAVRRQGPRRRRRTFTASSSGRRTSTRRRSIRSSRHIYAGPQGSFVPKAFAPFHRQQAHGGTRLRRRADRRHGDATRSQGVPRRLLEEPRRRRLPRPHPLDQGGGRRSTRRWTCTRVGIYGGSAGGQSALGALLAIGDFYKAAVADCGCHDNRMDKIWWNELWMG